MTETTTNPSTRPAALIAPAVALLLLLGMGVTQLRLPSPGDAEPYHTALIIAAAEAPTQFDQWNSVPVELPEAAKELLKLNASVCRSYHNADRGLAGEFMLVQCKDARDLGGHWPPNCYKANGYTQESAEPMTWQLNGQTFDGIRYHFVRDSASGRNGIFVDNFMILPGHGFVPDMASVRDAGADFTRRYLGAAQVQVVTTDLLAVDKRQTVFDELVTTYLPLINQVAESPLDTAPATDPQH